jgi:hypothetical protein
LASSAAVAAVAVASGVAWAGLPTPQGEDVAPAVTVSPAPSASSKPSPSVSAKPPTSSSTSAVPPASTPARLGVPQRLFYLSISGELQRMDGTIGAPLFQPRPESCGLTISPDRTRIAYVTADGGGATGDLIVARPNGADKKTVLHKVACTGGNSPLWLPGSQQLLLRQANTGPRMVLDLRTGDLAATPLKNVTGYVVWSPAGTYMSYQDSGKIVVARPDGTVVRRVAHADETPTGGFSVQGVSDDGRHVVVGMTNTDPDPIRTGFRLVDTQTGRNISLPASVAPKDPHQAAIYPTLSNHFLVRVPAANTHKLCVMSVDGKVLDTRTEPSDFRSATMLTSY